MVCLSRSVARRHGGFGRVGNLRNYRRRVRKADVIAGVRSRVENFVPMLILAKHVAIDYLGGILPPTFSSFVVSRRESFRNPFGSLPKFGSAVEFHQQHARGAIVRFRPVFAWGAGHALATVGVLAHDEACSMEGV
ncbi:hypothetical protein [Microcystis phage Mae-JY35]